MDRGRPDPTIAMLPTYADGSTANVKGLKKKKKPRKALSAIQWCILLMLLVWVVSASSFFFSRLERENGADAGGLVGLILLGPRSTYGQLWLRKCEAFLRAVEERFPVPGWTDGYEVGGYHRGQYLEKMRAADRNEADMVQAQAEAADPLAHAKPIGAVAGEMGEFFGGEASSPPLSAAGHPAQPAESPPAHVQVPGTDLDPDLPSGSYRGSCSGCTLSLARDGGKQLRCTRCKDSHGNLHDSVIHLADCHQNVWIENSNGVLTCGVIAPVPEKAVETSDAANTEAAVRREGKWPARPRGIAWDPAKVAILITVMDQNDLEALKATLQSLEAVPSVNDYSIFISQDAPSKRLNALIVKYQAKGLVKHLTPDLPTEENELLREARHVRTSVNTVFSLKNERGQAFERIIVFDHDLEFSPSVLTFFQAATGALDKDAGLCGISAWNELGLPHLLGDDRRMARDSYFSGVAWLMAVQDWSALNAVWPSDEIIAKHGWVHWVNDKAGAEGTHGGLGADVALRWAVEGWDAAKRRDMVVPQVSRVKRNGGGAFDPEEAALQQFSEQVLLSKAPPDMSAFGDLSYLEEVNYDAELTYKVRHARLLPGLVPPPASSAILDHTFQVIAYEPAEYGALAKRFQIPGRPMGQFHGATMLLRKDSSLFILVDKSSPHAPALLHEVAKDLHLLQRDKTR